MANQLTVVFAEKGSETIRKAAREFDITPGQFVAKAVSLYIKALRIKNAATQKNPVAPPKTP